MKFLKKNRLVSKADFQSVFDQPSKITLQYLQIFSRANSQGFPRLGIIINKSHAPKAVDRNRLRRIIRESFRLHMHEIPNIDVVVFVRRGWQKDSKMLRVDADNLWSKL